MERFTAELKATHPESDDLTRIEQALGRLVESKIAVVDGIEVSPVSRLPVKLVVLLQVGLRRTIGLSEAAIREMNGQELSAMCVLVRAVFETGCLMFDVAQRLEDVVRKGDPAGVEEFDDQVVHLLLGHKAKEWALSEEIVARNVLGIIQRLQKQLDTRLMWFYDGLSEHAHPNYHGMLGTYTKLGGQDVAITEFTDRREGRTHATTTLAISSMAIALDLIELALDKQDQYLSGFAGLAERIIYERGTWPKDVDYPIKRSE